MERDNILYSFASHACLHYTAPPGRKREEGKQKKSGHGQPGVGGYSLMRITLREKDLWTNACAGSRERAETREREREQQADIWWEGGHPTQGPPLTGPTGATTSNTECKSDGRKKKGDGGSMHAQNSGGAVLSSALVHNALGADHGTTVQRHAPRRRRRRRPFHTLCAITHYCCCCCLSLSLSHSLSHSHLVLSVHSRRFPAHPPPPAGPHIISHPASPP